MCIRARPPRVSHLTPRLAAVIALVAACHGPPSEHTGAPACESIEQPAARFRLFAVGHHVTLAEATSPEAFEAAIRATVAAHVEPDLARDRPNVLVFPESVALSAAFVGPRGDAARAQATATDAFTALAASHSSAIAFYAGRGGDAQPGRLVLLAVTDPLWRTFDGTFSRLARDLHVYVVAGIDIGDAATLEESTEDADAIAELADILGDPGRPEGAPVYWVPNGRVHNQAVFYGPDGALIGRVHKAYLTDLEVDGLDLVGGAPERLGPVVVGEREFGAAGLMRAGAMISRDAWMQDALERQAIRGADVLLQLEAFSGGWTIEPAGYPWAPDNVKRSGWAAVQKHPELRAAVAPMLVGNLFDVVFDGQSFAALPARPDDERRALLAQEPDAGWAAIAPWVEPAPETGTREEQRAALRVIGEALRPGGERDGEYRPGTVHVDVELPAGDGYPALDPAMPAAPGSEQPVLGRSAPVDPLPAGGRQRYAAPAVLTGPAFGPGGAVVVAWEDTRGCAGQIRVARLLSSEVPAAHGENGEDGVPGLPGLNESALPWGLPRASTRWSPSVIVRDSDRSQHTPSMVATADGALVVAWQERVGRDRAELWVARSDDAGATWSPVRVVPRPDADSGECDDASVHDDSEPFRPVLAVDDANGDIYLAFPNRFNPPGAAGAIGGGGCGAGDAGIDGARWRVYVTRSSDGGATWTEPVRPDPREPTGRDRTLAGEWSPALAARAGRVALAYTHRHRADPAEQPSTEVFVIESADRGASWGQPARLDPGGFPERLAADVALALAPDGSARVLYSSLRGTGYDADVAFATAGAGGPALESVPDADPTRDQWFPAIAAVPDPSRADWIVAWQDLRNGSNDIYLAWRTAGAFGPPARVDDAGASAAESWRPRLLVGPDGTVYAFWEDSRTGHAEIRAAAAAIPGITID